MLSKQNVLAIKVKVNRILKTITHETDYNSFIKQNNMSIVGINELNADNMNCTEDEVCKVHISTWRELISAGARDNDDVLISLQEYMEILTLKDSDFVYEILYDDNNEITGCLWMTSTMRMNFEMYGGYVSVDAMKRDINTLLWPYMATSMWNYLNQVCVGCEGILLSEREEAYKALLDFQVRYSRRSKDEVYGIACDGFLNQDSIHKMGFTNTRYVSDHWHLFNQVFPTAFGKHYAETLNEQLSGMVYSRSEEEFLEAYSSCKSVLNSGKYARQDHLDALKKLYDDRESFALYSISKIQSSRGRKGSTSAEANHSSLIIHLNGVRSVNNYKEKPLTLIKDVLDRQARHIIKWNRDLFNEDREMRVVESRLNSTGEECNLKEAATYLCKRSYQRFVSNWRKAKKDYSLIGGNQVKYLLPPVPF